MASFNRTTTGIEGGAGATNHVLVCPRNCRITQIHIVRTAGAALPAISFFNHSDRTTNYEVHDAITPGSGDAWPTVIPIDYENQEDVSASLYIQVAAGAGVKYDITLIGHTWNDS